MGTSKTKIRMLLAVALTLAMASNIKSDDAAGLGLINDFKDLRRTWNVHIVNQMNQNQVLTAHCRSKDDDLGVHKLAVGSEYKWHFHMNFGHSTLFWCDLTLGDNAAHASLRVFWCDDDEFWKACDYKDCIWMARKDGIYLKNIARKFDELRAPWQ